MSKENFALALVNLADWRIWWILYNAWIAWSGYALPFWCPIIISLDHPEEGTYSALN